MVLGQSLLFKKFQFATLLTDQLFLAIEVALII